MNGGGIFGPPSPPLANGPLTPNQIPYPNGVGALTGDVNFTRDAATGATTINDTSGNRLLLPYHAKAGVPQSATAEVQMLSSTGTISGGTFTLTAPKPGGSTGTTAATSVTATHATVATNLIAAGATGAVTVYGTQTLAQQWCPIIFAGTQANTPQTLITVDNTNVVGGGTFTVTRIQAGFAGDFVGAQPGDLAMDTTTGLLYVNTGTNAAPVWKQQNGYKNGRRVVFTGTSITAGGCTYLGVSQTPGSLWVGSAILKSSGRAQLVYNGGQSGATTAQIVAAQPFFEHFTPDWVMVEGGVNDIPTNANTTGTYAANIVPVNAAIVNLQAICEYWLARGVRVGITTSPANSAGKSFYVTQLNAKIKKLAQTLSAKWGVLIPLMDAHRVTVDPLAVGANGGNYLSSYSSDGTHPDLLPGIKAISDEFVANIMPSLGSTILPLAQDNGDVVANAFNLLPNTVAFVDTNADGVADNFATTQGGTIALTASIVTTDNATVPGKMQQVVNGATGTSTNFLSAFITGGTIAAGNRVCVAGRVTTAGFEAVSGALSIFFESTGGTYSYGALFPIAIDQTAGWFYIEFTMPPNGATNWKLQCQTSALSTTYRIGQVTAWLPDAL